jgi:hypothetical protein
MENTMIWKFLMKKYLLKGNFLIKKKIVILILLTIKKIYNS